MRINNVKQIRAEDFSEELQDDMSILGGILNPFMQEIFEFADGRVDFENLSFILKNLTVEVNSDGVPKVNNKLNTGKDSINGILVIRTLNLTNSQVYPTGQPWINYIEKGSGTVEIVNITNLPADNKFNLTILTF